MKLPDLDNREFTPAPPRLGRELEARR